METLYHGSAIEVRIMREEDIPFIFKSWFLQGLDTLYLAGHKWRE